MSYESLKSERNELWRVVKNAEAIARDDFYLTVKQSGENSAFIGFKGQDNKNCGGANESELRAIAAIKQAILEYAEPMRERIAVIDKKLAAIDELLKGTA